MLLCILAFAFSAKAQSSKSWLNTFERSGGIKTSMYDECISYCKRLAGSSSILHYTTFGKSEQARDLPLLILDADGAKHPEDLKNNEKLTLFIQACIHAGEPDGKDAGLILLRDILQDKLPADNLLKHVSVVFIPIFNVDGHERFGPYNRINQNGPVEMGWRANARNLNLNRDYLKADSKEMKAWLNLYNRLDPDFFIDCHTTDGADYQYVATYAMEIYGSADPMLTKWEKTKFIPYLEGQMKKKEMPIFPYVSFRNWHDPRSGLYSEPSSPMISQAYVAQRNRPALLIETHMLKDYRQRVDATYEMLLATLEYLNSHDKQVRKLNLQADQYTSQMSKNQIKVPLSFELNKNDSTKVRFLGVDYSVKKSDLTGGDWFTYDNSHKASFKLPYFKHSKVKEAVMLPYAYVIPPQYSDVIALLANHGVKMDTIFKESRLHVQTYQLKNPKWSSQPFEGHLKLNSVDVKETNGERVFPKWSVIVPTNQPGARVIAYLLEPYSDNSLLHWGYFNAIFEQKEYGESYVMEPLARKMLEEDPELKTAYEKKKKEDPYFADNPWAQINWFYLHSPYRDKEMGVYPIGRIMSQTEVDIIR